MNYEIKGTPFPVVICKLANGERMITEKGAMVWMSPNMEMSTVGGGLGRMFSKAFSGESMFQNIYTARGDGMITFGSCFPGRIVPLEIAPGREFVLQKSAFLASTDGVELSIHFNKKLGAAAFVLAAMIAFSRLYLYVHFPTDVMAGALIGIAIGCIICKISDTLSARRSSAKTN